MQLFHKKETHLDVEIDNCITEMEGVDKDSDSYKAMAENLDTLYKAKQKEASNGIDPNTVLTVGGSIVSVILILGWEQAHVVASKALNFVIKPKV